MLFDARHDAGDEPARPAHLDDGDQRAILFESGEGSASVSKGWETIAAPPYET
jgi:hypothetical protein